ncbi:MAG: ATP-binding protein [Candidatus Lambdaproteobacteria bacterium]|nr:ATP-binding protein [Candidatus Lambdaproteobacteria bacterium]
MREIPQDTLHKKLRDLNPHWQTSSIDPELRKYKQRRYFDLFYPLGSSTTPNRAVVLMGPRRVGKTVMLHHFIQKLIDSGKQPHDIVYLPLETPLFQGLRLEELVKLYKEVTDKDKTNGCIVIFDEIQYLNGWEVHLKHLVDTEKHTKFIASGSAAAALRMKSLESGAGRFTDFMLPPLTFYEFLDLQNLHERYFVSIKKHGRIEVKDIASLNREFIRYINFGGFPESVFSEAIQKNPERFIRSDIIDKVLLRDLPSLYGINDVQELTRLFYVLAYQTGNEITFENLSVASGLSKNTIKRYIEYLEAAFLIKTVKRVDNNGKTFNKINFFKVYLTNPSMYAALFGLVKIEDEIGSLVETAIFCQWIHAGNFMNNIHYARWKKGGSEGEVDIVDLEKGNEVRWCVEVKWSDRYFDNTKDLKSLIAFCARVGLDHAKVTTKSVHGEHEVEGLRIEFQEAAVYCYILGRNLIRRQAQIMENI